ncbi:sugar isomerase [Ophiostoma piceae UAMH 11346]|uniref:Sugar isomerase n=1 Tax=Ophiostoma piceae (strain UAMH 11346) TaxID=1262450 RepID=S3CCN4_OPHP1|nr:sugar isomerase [Ophiostoma piceae UAMH 11346]
MGERCPGPVQTSAVYVLGHTSQFVPPPSPPSPATGNSRDLCAPIEELSLDAVDTATATSTDAVATPTAAAAVTATVTAEDANSPTSPPGTAPDSPDLSPCVLSPNYSSCSLASYASSSADLSASDAVGADSLVSSIATISAATSTSTVPAVDNVSSRLAGAVHVLATEATALQSVAQLYATSPDARDGFDQAVEAIVRTQTTYPPGKLIVVGVGKSGHIGRKLVATFNSLAVPASFLHPTEALHGDLGHIRAHDALLFITYSGKSQELVSLLPHVDPALPLIILTGHITHDTCELVRRRSEANEADIHNLTEPGVPHGKTILLPAPIPVEEKVSFGVAAPTASTTTALAVGDALAIVTSKELHPSTESVFRRNHPGGAIGDAFKKQPNSSSSSSLSSLASSPPTTTVRHVAVPWKEIPVVQGADCADVLRAGYSSANGWVRILSKDPSTGSDVEFIAPPTRIRSLLSADLVRPVHEVGSRLVVGRGDLVSIAVDTKLSKAVEWVKTATAAEASEAGPEKAGDTVVAVMEYGEIIGVLELQDLLKAEAL